MQPKRVLVRDPETGENTRIEVGVDDVAEILWESDGVTVLKRDGVLWTWYPNTAVLVADGGEPQQNAVEMEPEPEPEPEEAEDAARG